MTPTTIVLGFLLSAAAVVLAGVALARSGDVIAARTRLGGVWVGSIFLAAATSLPELATDISAVRLGVPDLAAGDLFGSSMANMLILALLSLIPGAHLFHRAALDHVIAAALAIFLTCTAAIFVLVETPAVFLGIGTGSMLLGLAYLAGTRVIFRQSALLKRATAVEEMASGEVRGEAKRPATLRGAIVIFVAASAAILVVAPFFATSATALAELTGLSTTFLGTWLVATATSLPELVTSLAAFRMGAYDLAVGNLFGSNAMNMVLFLPLDLAHPAGPIFATIHPVHAISGLVAVALMAIGLGAIIYRAGGRVRLLEPISLVMLLTYMIGLGLVFAQSAAR